LPPIYDDYNDSGILVPPTMESKFYYDYTMPPTLEENNNDSYFVKFAPTITNKTSKVARALRGQPVYLF
jgi:hypothetical protein